MIRGGDFYAIWDEESGLWSTDEDDATRLIDSAIDKYLVEQFPNGGSGIRVLHMWDSDSGVIAKWHAYCQRHLRDNYHPLDETLIFANNKTVKTDYASRKLGYPLELGPTDAWDRLVGTLYNTDERHKIEWVIGAIVSGDSKTMQKFMVFYGSAGTGKSTILNIIQMLFEGYYSVFDAKALGSASDAFALEPFKKNPLVAIQHDGDLSRIEDNTRLNSVVSHELMTVNEKHKSLYEARFKAFLLMGTNRPVKITDGKSGLLRRLIDVSPSGKKLSQKEYDRCMDKVKFELGAIAQKCLDIYREDPYYYNTYVPVSMMGASNDFYNFIEENIYIFEKEDGVSLKQAWELYKQYVDEAKIPYAMSKIKFKEELRNYFWDFADRYVMADGTRVRNYYTGFRTDKFEQMAETKDRVNEVKVRPIEFREMESVLDKMLADCPAQYASDDDKPLKKWEKVKTVLSELDTSRVHYVKVPENHIVIDFDLKDETGHKSFERNLEEASKWPATYAELSKGGEGIHLHYLYSGDASELSRIYSEDVEVKVFTGDASLRRRLSKCNSLPVATLSSGLPKKGGKKMVTQATIKSERGIRNMIERNLAKEFHGATKPSVDFIKKILDDAYEAGIKYDVSDMKNAVVNFAMHSSNQAETCMKLVSQMKFKSEEASADTSFEGVDYLTFYDVEVFPNLFVVCYKKQGPENKVVSLINPSPSRMEELMKEKLVGFNCRKYDNHIIYARMMGYTEEQLYKLSQSIVTKGEGFFREAYNVSYTDIYDFAAKKQGLKKWEIELGIHHLELGLPWDQPVDESLWDKVGEYCQNDVTATEAVFEHLAGDFTARKILAELAGSTVNNTTNQLTTKIIFGNEKHPALVYTDLSKEFPGYQYIPAYEAEDGKAHNMYRGVDLGFGGYVYAEPGCYIDVGLLDVASLHPHSIIAMNCFGEYTERFHDILNARMYIKHKEFDKARKMLDGKLAPYLDDEGVAKDLAQALKIAINSVYGLTSAKFSNPFKDERNVNNIVALRGALFMKTLQDEVEAKGFKVAHIKTDSIKIPNMTDEIKDFCMNFAQKYGYTFEHEATYEKLCLVTKADYVAKDKGDGHWTQTGAAFQHPFVFKTLFTKEQITFEDMCETFSVKEGDLYLDMNEGMADGEQNLVFVGRVGQFSPIAPGKGGGVLYRVKDGKCYAAAGSTGYRFLESEMVKELGKEKDIDLEFYRKMVDDAVEKISEYTDIEWFTEGKISIEYIKGAPEELPFN